MKTILPKLALLAVLLLLPACSKDPDADRAAAVTKSIAQLANCSQANGAENPTNLALVSVTSATNETSLKLVIYATDSAVEFPLPAYKLSAGRWLIGEKDRAYLIDDHCQEFKLKDRRPPAGRKFPQDGIMRLNPGESFEMTLSFYRLKDTTRFGMLVYAGKTLPFIVYPPNPKPTNHP